MRSYDNRVEWLWKTIARIAGSVKQAFCRRNHGQYIKHILSPVCYLCIHCARTATSACARAGNSAPRIKDNTKQQTTQLKAPFALSVEQPLVRQRRLVQIRQRRDSPVVSPARSVLSRAVVGLRSATLSLRCLFVVWLNFKHLILRVDTMSSSDF